MVFKHARARTRTAHGKDTRLAGITKSSDDEAVLSSPLLSSPSPCRVFLVAADAFRTAYIRYNTRTPSVRRKTERPLKLYRVYRGLKNNTASGDEGIREKCRDSERKPLKLLSYVCVCVYTRTRGRSHARA